MAEVGDQVRCPEHLELYGWLVLGQICTLGPWIALSLRPATLKAMLQMPACSIAMPGMLAPSTAMGMPARSMAMQQEPCKQHELWGKHPPSSLRRSTLIVRRVRTDQSKPIACHNRYCSVSLCWSWLVQFIKVRPVPNNTGLS